MAGCSIDETTMDLELKLADLDRAVRRLREALQAGSENSLFVDAAIQRFEFCVELAWKALQGVLERDHGIAVASPKPAFQEAFRVGLFDDEATWLSMLRDRNLTSHTYREALAREIHGRLPAYLERLDQLVRRIA